MDPFIKFFIFMQKKHHPKNVRAFQKWSLVGGEEGEGGGTKLRKEGEGFPNFFLKNNFFFLKWQ